MKLKGKMNHEADKFEDIMADMPSEHSSMLEALMLEVNALTSDGGPECETDLMKAERTGYAKGMASILMLKDGGENALKYIKPSYMVERLIKTAKSEKELVVWSKSVSDIVGCQCEEPHKKSDIKTKAIKMSDLPKEVRDELEKLMNNK